MSEPKILKLRRTCKDCGKPMPRAISRHYCPLKRQCKRCKKPIPKGNRGLYCSFACYRPVTTFTCETCSKEFRGKPNDKPRFCSRECYERHRQAQIAHTCEQCGKRFQRPNCDGREYHFCSKKCTGAAQSRKVHLTCAYCNSPITRQPGIAKANKPYCSKSCHNLARMDRMAINCERCGAEFTVTRYFTEKRKARFCSKLCQRKHSGETGIEKKIREALDSLSIAYIQEYPIQHNKKSNRRGSFYFLDFFLPNSGIAIEADGTYWHKSRQDSDARRDLFLSNQGITVIRLTDKEIESVDSISDLLRQRITKLR